MKDYYFLDQKCNKNDLWGIYLCRNKGKETHCKTLWRCENHKSCEIAEVSQMFYQCKSSTTSTFLFNANNGLKRIK